MEKVEEVLDLFGRTAFRERAVKEVKKTSGGLERTTVDRWLAWQRYRQHEQEVEALDAEMWRAEDAAILKSSLWPEAIQFSLLEDEDYEVFCQVLEYMKQYQLRKYTAPESLNQLPAPSGLIKTVGQFLSLNQPQVALL